MNISWLSQIGSDGSDGPFQMAQVSPASPLGMLLAPEKLIHSPRLRIYCQMLARGGVRFMETDGDVVMGEPIKEETRNWIDLIRFDMF